MEFANKYNPKVIDWNYREDKVRHTIPYWRKNSIQIPPTKAYNKFAIALSEEIRAGKVSFDSEALKAEYENFFKKQTTIIEQMKRTAGSSSGETVIPEIQSSNTNNNMRNQARSGKSNFNRFQAPHNNYKTHRNFTRGQQKSNYGGRNVPYTIPSRRLTHGRGGSNNNNNTQSSRQLGNKEGNGMLDHAVNNIFG